MNTFTKTTLALCGLAITLTSTPRIGAAAALPTMDQILQQSMRYPIIAVPLVEKAPIIDGTVGDEEWAQASVIPDLIYDAANTSQRNGVAAQHRSRYFIEYTQDALYIATRYDLPDYVAGPAASETGNQDNVDIYLNPLGKFQPGEKWHFEGSASGKFWGRDLASEHVARLDNAKMEFKTHVFKGGWETEFRIPFTLMQAPTPVPGQLWRANFIGVRITPIPSVSAWSYLKTWRQPPRGLRDGWLVFAGKPLGVRFDQGAGEFNRDGIEIRLTGAVPQEGVEVTTQLFKRKDQPTPQDPSLFVKLADMVDNSEIGGSNFYGMDFPTIVNTIKKELDPIGQPVTTKLDAASAAKAVRVKAAELGEYLLTYQVVSGQGDKRQVLCAGSLPLRIEPPVSMKISAFELLKGKRRFDVDFSTLATLTQAKKVKITVVPASGGAAIESQAIDAGKGFAQWEVASRNWPAGSYTVTAEVLDALGKVLGSTTSQCEKKSTPDWYTKKEGMEPEVPEPWTAVQAKEVGGKTPGGVVRVVGREYRFDGQPVPSSIQATPFPLSKAEPPQPPHELLAAPIELAVTTGGRKVLWQTKQFKLESQRPSEIVFASENSADGLTLTARTKVEFDGMIRVDFSLASAGGTTTKIDKFDLIIPHRGEEAQLMSTYRKAPGPGTKLERYLGRVPANDWKYSVFYTHFIGNNKVGLEWFCDSMKGWRVKKGDEAVEVVRRGDRLLQTFHLVDHEVALDKPIEIYFGLIATPTKPIRRGWEIMRFDQQAYMPSLPGDPLGGGKLATQADTDAWIRRMEYARVKENLWFAWNWTGVEWFQYPVKANPVLFAQRKKQFDIAHAVGQKVCPWGSWFCIPTSIPEWDLWGAEMAVQPMRADLGKSFTACYNSPFTDFLVANFAANARDLGTDGFRHDTIAPQLECSSEEHGCGWRDENGKLWPSQNLFAAREYFKRLYRIFHGGIRTNGVCYFPLAGPPVNCLDSFVDIHEIGEGSFERGLTLKDGYPQDDVRVRMVGTAYGFVTSNNLKGAPLTMVERCAALLVAGANPRFAFAGSPSVGLGYQRGLPNTWANVVPTWNAWEWIDLGNTSIWKPYWENTDTLSLSAPVLSNGKPPEMYGSYYYIPGKRILLIVTNYEQEPIAGLVAKLDLQKLGFANGAKLYGEDALTQEPIDVNDGAVLLDLFAQRYRMIKIAADKPRLHSDNLGANLLAAGGFEDWKSVQITRQPTGQTAPFAKQDTAQKHGGAAALKVEKTGLLTSDSAMLELPACPVEGGDYVMTGYVRIDKDLTAAVETVGGNPRMDYTYVNVNVAGEGVVYDPPLEFCSRGGSFPVCERTPGWLHFVIPFKAAPQTKQVKVAVLMNGGGTAWVDDVEVRRIK